MDLAQDDPLRADIVEMENASKRCKEIIENLLGFSRQQDSSEEQNFDLREIIQHSLRLLELRSRSSGVRVDVQLPTTPVMVHGHPNLLTQALNHILQNSLDSIDQRAESQSRFKGQIGLELSLGPQNVELLIKDNGIGIDPGAVSQVANPLFSNRGRPNAGLGLSLAFKIIDDHHGRLEVSSQPNSGTEVKISLNNV
jgi:signal transduction histidine kinase